MKRFLAFLMGLFISSAALSETLTLEKANTVVFRGVVGGDTVAKAQKQLLELDKKLPAGKPIYLFLDTPGGSISDGMDLVRLAKSLDREIKTVTLFAASMGFIFAQELGERLVLEDGILMAHRAKIGLQGQMPGEFVTRSNFFYKQITGIETDVAKRLGKNLKEYRSMSLNEYWATGTQAVKDKTADRTVAVKCGKSLRGTYKETVQVFIFSIEVTWSECPLVTAPLQIGGGEDLIFATESHQAQVQDYIRKLFYSKQQFLKEYIMTNKFQELK